LVGVDTVESRLQAAVAGGADLELDSRRDGWMKEAGAPKVVIEATGVTDAVGLAFQSVAQFGRVTLLASTRGESTINFYRDVHRKGITIVGAHATLTVPSSESRPGFWTWREEAECFIRLLAAGRFRVEPLLSAVVDWHEAPTFYQRIL
jgi:threonine dehydrogenase-like Zn-dependent dehydrogenase